jgi:hypothetical protein
MRNVIGALVGIAVAIITVMVLQKIGHIVFPPPADLDFENRDAVAAYMQTLPIGAFVFVLASYIIAAFDGTFAACLVGRAMPVIYALIVGGMMLIGTVANLALIPHPTWFSITAIIGIIVAAWLAAQIAAATVAAMAANQ